MGLFGALFAGVAGLGSQSNKIGIVSNNISNVNTVGYKQGSAAFNTLVVPSASTGSFSPGGVLGNNRQLVSQQGLIQATTSVTDVAISGGGLFVVNTRADGTGDTLYTRAGSFTQDSNGNFRNAAGFFLQGLQVQTPALSVNPGNLTTVNVNQNATGSSVATSLITIAANFNAKQIALLGAGEVTDLSADSANSSNNATAILVPTSGTSGNNLARGDVMNILAGTTNYAFTYGGFTIGRDVTTGAAGDGSTDLSRTLVTNSPPSYTTGPTTGQITITVPSPDGNNYVAGQLAYINGVSGTVSGITAAQLNGQNLTVVSSTATSVVLSLPSGVTAGATGVVGGGAGITVTNRTYDYAGNMLDATADSDDFLGTTGSTVFATSALNFSATVNGATYTFRYNAAPNTNNSQFNSLNTLVTTINNSTDGNLVARIVDHKLYISGSDPNNSVTFTNGDADGAGSGPVGTSGGFQPGINWIQELDLQDVTAATTGVNRFDSLQSLADKVNSVNPTGAIVATINNPTGISTLSINSVDPQATIQFSDDATINTGGSIIQALGFIGANGAPLTTQTMANVGAVGFDTGTFASIYSPTDPTKNMSSGNIAPQFTKDITIYDALGINHTISMNVLKLSTNQWAVEFTASPQSDVNVSSNDGQIAYGIVNFAGDGSLASISSGSLQQASITIPWTNGSDPSSINFNMGTSGETDGLTQFSGSSNVSIARQNGSPTGQLTGVSIDENGFVTASFSNGQTQQLYQIPLASVNNPNGLSSVSGNAYKQTLDSGEVSLNLAGTNGTGTLAASALEQSNVDLSTQLTDLIVAQQAYGANTRVLTVTSQLLQELNRIIG